MNIFLDLFTIYINKAIGIFNQYCKPHHQMVAKMGLEFVSS